MRILVAIACFGTKNLDYLRHVVARYRRMPYAVDIIVLSEADKAVPDGVELHVGLPSTNPWSLPFGHKPIFAERIDEYDLFIYSEDDIGVSTENVEAFLDACGRVQSDELPGFLRYECTRSGERWMPDVHGMFHWEPDSVVDREGCLFARYTNEHAALYMLTRSQLQVAIASGGFLREPYEGKYDMLCAAATDPYTSCGLRKVIAIDRIELFLVHHISNRYAGEMGLPFVTFEKQLDTLRAIYRGQRPATTLCSVESKIVRSEWSKSFYEVPHAALLDALPTEMTSALSVGCGWGATEAELVRRGADVTALPLDSVIGAEAERYGVQTLYGQLDECLRNLGDKTFDCVLVTNLLHLQEHPDSLFDRCARLVHAGGRLVIDSPNFDRLTVLLKRVGRDAPYRSLSTHADGGITAFGPGRLVRSAQRAGLRPTDIRWYNHSLPRSLGLKRLPVRLGRLTAQGWLFAAARTASS
jgi:2-polyprenyl-3-methyl-5-hydroxy-6-metoxy-1,4-benzoquinol methylase